ncbi:PLP-dependent aminotransferase family protein [Agromyces sp. NPDC057679]|uniref:MocR-like pyridoxine biosynthesis transcription factor PdxR n=1 Tax=Agromyces sp. NPDC057679 TaxID=3346207 RepID=UPI0036731AA1
MDGPLLVLDRREGVPLGVQLVDGIRRGILGGLLEPGDPVPSTRSLAAELGISRSSVVAAYEQLAGEGYLELRQGAPTRVARLVVEPEASAPSARPMTVGRSGDRTTSADAAHDDERPHHRIDLLPGSPSTARIDERAWRSAWRRAAAAPIPRVSPPRAGLAGLREEIADHLRQARGVACTRDDIVVTAGTSDALGLLGAALLELVRDDRPGGAPPVVAVEHPGYPSARRLLERRGLAIAPLPVDVDGLDLDALRRMHRPPQAVMVTPSHQYPLGGRLPVASRLELIDWARATGALIIEDDYDSEFRHLGAPLPALASLDRLGAASVGDERGAERTVLVGSFSKVLTPWLRLGYLVLPGDPALRAAVLRIRADEPCPVPGPAQEAMRAFLASGALRRHITATRRDYAHRRRMVQAALGELPGAPLSGLDGGLHAVVELADAEASASIVARLADEGVGVAPLADYSAVPGERPGGIVFGYAGVGDAQLGEGLARIRAALVDTLDPAGGEG